MNSVGYELLRRSIWRRNKLHVAKRQGTGSASEPKSCMRESHGSGFAKMNCYSIHRPCHCPEQEGDSLRPEEWDDETICPLHSPRLASVKTARLAAAHTLNVQRSLRGCNENQKFRMRLCAPRNITQISRGVYRDKLPRPQRVSPQCLAMSLDLLKNKRREVTS